jgi:hypothetical protein
MKSFRLNQLPLKIHTWGGFGSQIYGLALAKEIRKSSGRRINLVLHTGGVTERQAEISSTDHHILISHKYDYSSTVPNRAFINKARWGRRIIKTILLKMRIVMDDSNLHSKLSVKPWTRTLRGHYTSLSFSRSTLLEIADEVSIPTEKSALFPKFDILVHYRLGDLLTLASKSPIDTKCFAFLEDLAGDIYVVSDSPEIASRTLSETLNRTVKPLLSRGGWDVVSLALTSKYFVGSSSKVSDWAILYRLLLQNSSYNYAPASRKTILDVLCNSVGTDKIDFYLDN